MEKQIPEYNNILIVDDQLPNLKVLASMLKQRNYKVRKATNGASAIEATKLNPPNLILLDIMMPDMNGYQVCENLKSDPKTRHIPIIFLSALSEVFDKLKAFEVGGIDYITKPFQEEEVLARIKSQLMIQKQKKLLEQKQRKLITEIKQRKNTEAHLSQSRTLIAGVLHSSLDGIIAWKSIRNEKTKEIVDFRYLVANSVIAQIFECKYQELNNQLTLKKLLENFWYNLLPLAVQVVETGKSLQKDFSYQKKGRQKWCHCVIVKLEDGCAMTFKDITDRKKLELELNRLATMDGLTRINNRRSFDLNLTKQWEYCFRKQQPLSLIIMDIDYFKYYNDHYGHQQGDDCLIRVAQAISSSLSRSGDFVARYGGEEFAVVLPNTNEEGALKVAQTIRTKINFLHIPHEKSKVSKNISLSLGISTMIPIQENSYENLIAQADKALYTAKNQGRNCVKSFNDTIPLNERLSS